MTDLEFLEQVKQTEKSLGFKYRKFSGALVTEILRNHLIEKGISCSQRDVYIKDIPIEVDLLIVKEGAIPSYNVLWKPEDVIAAIEVKKSGLISDASVKISSDFHRIKSYHPHIKLFYISLTEEYKKITPIARGDGSFVFFIRKNGKFSSTGDFDRMGLSIV